ncbi:hypothetical protein [Aporhodopirellula aestuarii]|uniref:50S ribosomal protein L29 n=1 Tax=Aporhodopirellula aestuarii TaxID=2950107 RepID=A0ABT0UAX0_9BACT|nr:hypothetical protein [Aporhodopirellula aestuarii]MCM2374157.1 hypothetical protein [Aporhodopirellula aestuarii]
MATIQERIDDLESHKDALIVEMATGTFAKRTRQRFKELENFEPAKIIAVIDQRIAELRAQADPMYGTLAAGRRRARLQR